MTEGIHVQVEKASGVSAQRCATWLRTLKQRGRIPGPSIITWARPRRVVPTSRHAAAPPPWPKSVESYLANTADRNSSVRLRACPINKSSMDGAAIKETAAPKMRVLQLAQPPPRPARECAKPRRRRELRGQCRRPTPRSQLGAEGSARGSALQPGRALRRARSQTWGTPVRPRGEARSRPRGAQQR